MELHGLLLVDKPAGLTSHDVVAKLRYLLKMKAIGHAGTLDPMATGLMVMLLGEGTKLSQHVLNGDKAYAASIRLGIETDSGDITGKIIKESTVPAPSLKFSEIVDATLANLKGPQEFEVPRYSAIKVKGEKLYEKARAEEEFIPPKRAMTFFNFTEILHGTSEVSLHLHCSKGSYIRSFAVELGKSLGTLATLSSLRRTHSFPYQIEQALNLEDIEKILVSGGKAALSESPCFVTLDSSLPDWPHVKVEGMDEKLILNGQVSHTLDQMLYSRYLPLLKGAKGVKVLSRRSQRLLALVEPNAQKNFKIQRVFSLNR